MRNLDIADTRAKLNLYADTGLLSSGEGSPIFKLENDKVIGRPREREDAIHVRRHRPARPGDPVFQSASFL